MNVFFATRVSKTKAYFCVANHVSTLLNHKTHLLDPKDAPDGLGSLRAWSLIRRASSPPSPAVREKGKNSRATHVEKLISPLLMLGERSRPKVRFGNKKGSGVRVAQPSPPLKQVPEKNNSSLELHNPRALQGVA